VVVGELVAVGFQHGRQVPGSPGDDPAQLGVDVVGNRVRGGGLAGARRAGGGAVVVGILPNR
jgi:hypothetical protein